MLTGTGNDIFGTSIFVLPNNVAVIEAEFALPLILKLLPTILSIIGAATAVYIYTYQFNLLVNLTNTKLGRSLYRFINGKALIDIVINQYIISSSLTKALNISKVLDRGIIELIGAYGLSTSLSQLSSIASRSIAKLGTNIPQYSIFIAFSMFALNFILNTNIGL
jgi:NADH-ubiquinone oxidoreductase chain 5